MAAPNGESPAPKPLTRSWLVSVLAIPPKDPMTKTKDKDEEQSRTERSSDEKLLKKMKGILSDSIDWWESCAQKRIGKGLGASKDSAISALQVIEKLEARISGETHISGNWRVVFANPPEELTEKEPSA